MVYRYIGMLFIGAGMMSPTISWSAETLGVHFSWASTAACSSTPPAFTITNIPKGTKYLVFKLVDHDAPDFVHGGGQISYSGSGRIPAGAFGGSYNGPCPPQGAVHTYEWTVRAVDDSGTKVLAEGSATGRFPAK
jgi:phosphatidylethanolamine-binding protein (PEBP) family uncharacterized protein